MDPLRNTLQSMRTNTKSAYDKIDEMGGELPANKNLQNLAEAIRSIPTGPAVPKSLEELKKMVNRGREIAIGTEIPDTYGGNSNPLIVAQNLNSTNNASYGGTEGVILIRRYCDPVALKFNATNDKPVYIDSNIQTYLNSTYWNNTSDTLKQLITPITVPYYDGTNMTSIQDQKWFLMGCYEVCGQNNYGTQANEGIMWDYWKKQTGLSSPNSDANDGRITRDRNGTACWTWLRSRSYSSVLSLNNVGGVYNGSSGVDGSVLPACFIGKD